MNNHQQFLSSLAAQQNANAQAGLGDDVSINKHQFGANVDLSETYKLIVRKGNKVVESMKVNPKEIDDAIKFAKAQHKGLNVTVEKNGKVVREEWEEYSEPISISEMNYIGSDKKFGRKFYEKDGQLHVKSKTGTQTQNLGSVDVKSNAKMIKGLKKEETEVEEAIKYDSAGDSTGTVTGKGKRDRGPGGKVTVKYKGSDTYKDGAKLPIGARDMGRLIKTARKKGTTPYDSRNLKNPRLTKDHVEHEVDEGMMDKAKKAAKMLGKPVPRDVHNPGRPTKKSAGDVEAERREKERVRLSRREGVEVDEGYNVTATHDNHMKASAAIGSGTSRRGPLAGGKSLGDGKYNLRFDNEKTGKKFMQKHGFKEEVEVDENYEARKVMRKMGVQGVITPKGEIKVPMRDRKRLDAALKKNNIKNYKMSSESFEKLTPAQERDADRRLKPTRSTVSKVRLRAGEKDVAKSVKAYQSDKGGKPGNTKTRRMRDLRMKLEDTDSIKEGPAHQNPLTTAYGGMKAAQNTPSFKRYQAKLKADREARAKQHEKDKAAEKATKEEVEQIDELDAGTLIRYNNKASAQVTRDLKTDQGKHTPKTNKRMKGALKARRKLDKIMPGLRQEAQVDELKMPKNPNNPKIKAAKRKGAERAFSKFAKHSSDSLRAVDKGDSKKADSSFNKGERAFKRYNDREKGSY